MIRMMDLIFGTMVFPISNIFLFKMWWLKPKFH